MCCILMARLGDDTTHDDTICLSNRIVKKNFCTQKYMTREKIFPLKIEQKKGHLIKEYHHVMGFTEIFSRFQFLYDLFF